MMILIDELSLKLTMEYGVYPYLLLLFRCGIYVCIYAVRFVFYVMMSYY